MIAGGIHPSSIQTRSTHAKPGACYMRTKRHARGSCNRVNAQAAKFKRHPCIVERRIRGARANALRALCAAGGRCAGPAPPPQSTPGRPRARMARLGRGLRSRLPARTGRTRFPRRRAQGGRRRRNISARDAPRAAGLAGPEDDDLDVAVHLVAGDLPHGPVRGAYGPRACKARQRYV